MIFEIEVTPITRFSVMMTLDLSKTTSTQGDVVQQHVLLYGGTIVGMITEFSNKSHLYVRQGNKTNNASKEFAPYVLQRFGLLWKEGEQISTESMLYSLRSFFEPIGEHAAIVDGVTRYYCPSDGRADATGFVPC